MSRAGASASARLLKALTASATGKSIVSSSTSISATINKRVITRLLEGKSSSARSSCVPSELALTKGGWRLSPAPSKRVIKRSTKVESERPEGNEGYETEHRGGSHNVDWMNATASVALTVAFIQPVILATCESVTATWANGSDCRTTVRTSRTNIDAERPLATATPWMVRLVVTFLGEAGAVINGTVGGCGSTGKVKKGKEGNRGEEHGGGGGRYIIKGGGGGTGGRGGGRRGGGGGGGIEEPRQCTKASQ